MRGVYLDDLKPGDVLLCDGSIKSLPAPFVRLVRLDRPTGRKYVLYSPGNAMINEPLYLKADEKGIVRGFVGRIDK